MSKKSIVLTIILVVVFIVAIALYLSIKDKVKEQGLLLPSVSAPTVE
ncbi:MAG: hypothetical protein WC705_00310 [Candidatus Paceibacterota bacterium]|jgi:hypothetical protein